MLARYWPSTSAPSTAIVHIRAGINGRPTTTRAWSCHSTRPYAGNVSSAAYSTNTNEQPDHNYKRAGHGQRGVLARDTQGVGRESGSGCALDGGAFLRTECGQK